MTRSKGGAAGAKRSRGQSTNRKRATKRDREGVAWVSGSGDGGFGDGGELDGVGDVNFIGVRGSPPIVEIKDYVKGHDFYTTVKGGKLVAAIIHDVARVYVDPNHQENRLNVLKVESCINKKAPIEHTPIGKRFLVNFVKQRPLKLDDLPYDLLSLESKDSGKAKFKFKKLKQQIVKQGIQCFQQLEKEITGDREQLVHGRGRKEASTILPYLAENDDPQQDDRIQASKDQLAEVVAELAPSNGKSLDAKDEAARSALITFLKVQLQKLEPAQYAWGPENHNLEYGDGDSILEISSLDDRHPKNFGEFSDGYCSQWTDIDALQARYNN